MKIFQIAIAFVIGGLAIYTSICPVKEVTLFFSWIYSVPLVCLCLLALVFLILNVKHYKNISSLFPFIICLTCLLVALFQTTKRESLDNAENIFKATTNEIGGDGGFILYFKGNGYLKAERQDHWAVTYYWGKYYCRHDTIKLDIPLNFSLGRKTILTDTSLNFIGDTIFFQVTRNQ